MEFKERLAKLRRLSGMTQAELAKELGITLRSVQNYELGARYPKTETIERIANIFGIDQSALISDEEYFIVEAKQKRGKRGQESAERLIRNANALFAGGDLSDEDKKNVFAALQKAYLETVGDCVLVVDDDEIIKVHVHTNNPGKVIEKALEYGYINLPKIENMKLQHDGKKKEQKKSSKRKEVQKTVPEKKFGFVAVAAGHGLEAMFKDLGADVVVTGGQTMNPSTEDILDAIYQTPAETVFILPNNKNIIMASEQAVKFADRGVCVLQTRTIPQGIAAMLAFDESADISENRINMTRAFERVSTGLVTFAARDTEFDGKHIKKGEILALENNSLAYADKDINKIVLKLVKKLVKSDTSYVTLIYGSDVTDENAEKMQKLLSQKLNDRIEVMLVNGGQPVYYYIISVE